MRCSLSLFCIRTQIHYSVSCKAYTDFRTHIAFIPHEYKPPNSSPQRGREGASGEAGRGLFSCLRHIFFVSLQPLCHEAKRFFINN